jgi:hypothetical protein
MVVKNVFWALFAMFMVMDVHTVGFATPEEPWDEYCNCYETPCSSPDPEDLTPVDFVSCYWFSNPGSEGSCACTKENIENVYVIPDDPATRVCKKNTLGEEELSCGDKCTTDTAPSSCANCESSCPYRFVRPAESACNGEDNPIRCVNPEVVVCAGTQPS